MADADCASKGAPIIPRPALHWKPPVFEGSALSIFSLLRDE